MSTNTEDYLLKIYEQCYLSLSYTHMPFLIFVSHSLSVSLALALSLSIYIYIYIYIILIFRFFVLKTFWYLPVIFSAYSGSLSLIIIDSTLHIQIKSVIPF